MPQDCSANSQHSGDWDQASFPLLLMIAALMVSPPNSDPGIELYDLMNQRSSFINILCQY
jgi:hypothetical protein